MLNKSCQWLDSNPGPLESEATALPTVSQPLPTCFLFVKVVGREKQYQMVTYLRKQETIGWTFENAFPDLIPSQIRNKLGKFVSGLTLCAQV